MQDSSHSSPRGPISQFCDSGTTDDYVATTEVAPFINSTYAGRKVPAFIGGNDNAQVALLASLRPISDAGGTASYDGEHGNLHLRDRPMLGWGRNGRETSLRLSRDISAATADADQGAQAPHSPLIPTDPYAEGQRARRAGLTMDEQPYLLWPIAAERWAAGFKGEMK